MEIPESVENIDDWAFAYCTKLVSVTIDKSTLQSIGKNTFRYCSSRLEFN